MSPMRVKSRPQAGLEAPPSPLLFERYNGELPGIDQDDSFKVVVRKLSL